MPKRQRTISYLRAVWEPEPNVTLEGALRDELSQRPNAGDTRVPFGDRSIESRHRRTVPPGVRLHVAAWTEGEAASTVPHTADSVEADLATQPPPENSDYLNGDGMVFVSDNHCLLMPSRLLAPSLHRYLQELVKHVGQFQLHAIGNASVMDQIRQEGVKKIDLDISQYAETATQAVETRETIRRNLGREILASLIERDEDRQRIEEADNVHARLVINLDTRRRSGLSAEELGSMLASIEGEDGMIIETGSGQRFRHGQMVMRKAVDVETFGQTVHHGPAWEEMETYLDELRQQGALED